MRYAGKKKILFGHCREVNTEVQMDLLKVVSIQCPYCGETIEVLVDCSIPRQEYIEDCEVCCRPIAIFVNVAESDSAQVEVRQEDE